MTPYVDIVARTIWGEARGTGSEGMHAVANVIANRVNNPRWWGQDWVSVCQQPAQFSCWNSNDPNRPKLLAVDETDQDFRAAIFLAQAAIDGTLPDLTGGADHYYATASPEPYWAKTGVKTYADNWHTYYQLELHSLPRQIAPPGVMASAPPVEDIKPMPAPTPVIRPASVPLNTRLNEATTQGTSGLTMGASGAIAILISGVLEHYGLFLSQDQFGALIIVLSIALHPIGVMVFGEPTTPKPPAP